MALVSTVRSYVGKGSLYAMKKVGGLGLLPVGNCKSLAEAITEDVKTEQDYEHAGGGTKNTLRRISKIEATAELYEFSAANLALVTRGEVSFDSSGSVAAEAHTAYTAAAIPFDHLLDSSASVTPVIAVSGARVDTTPYVAGACILASAVVYQCTTAGTTGGSAPTYSTSVGATTTDGSVVWTSRGAVTMVDGTDFEIINAGIKILPTASRFALGLPITIAYTKNDAEILQSFLTSADEYELFFDGLNEVDSGNPCPVRFWRVQFGVAANIPLIMDDFTTLSVKFDVLQDSTKAGTGISQYMQRMQVA